VNVAGRFRQIKLSGVQNVSLSRKLCAKIEQKNVSSGEYVCLMETLVHLWVVTCPRSFCTVRVMKSLCGQWTLRPRVATKCSELLISKILSLKQEDECAFSQGAGNVFRRWCDLAGFGTHQALI
jgi:hypothetical protein